jgi:hypothetical protein
MLQTLCKKVELEYYKAYDFFFLWIRETIKLENTVIEKKTVKQYSSFIKHAVNNAFYCQMDQRLTSPSFHHGQYYHSIQPVSTTISPPFKFSDYSFLSILISLKPATFLVLLIHSHFRTIVINIRRRAEVLKVRSHVVSFPFGPHTVFSTLFSRIMNELPNHMKTSEEEKSL